MSVPGNKESVTRAPQSVSAVSLHSAEEATVIQTLNLKLKPTDRLRHPITCSTNSESPICPSLAESFAFQCVVLGAFGGLPLWTWHTHCEIQSEVAPTGRSEATSQDPGCKVGQQRDERDEDMCHVSGSSAAPQHPSRWVKDMFLFFFLLNLLLFIWFDQKQWDEDTWHWHEIQFYHLFCLERSGSDWEVWVHKSGRQAVFSKSKFWI